MLVFCPGFLIPALSMFLVTQATFEWRYVAVFLLALSQAGIEIAIMGGFLLSNIDLAPQYSGVIQVPENAHQHKAIRNDKTDYMFRGFLILLEPYLDSSHRLS